MGAQYQNISQFSLNLYVIQPSYTNYKMPRKEPLATITPNRYYEIEATVKYFHRTEHGATAVIEQDQVQKKVLLSPQTQNLDEGVIYRFSKCFYSRNGWLRAKEGNLIEQIKTEENVSLSLDEINQGKESLENNYVTTTLQLVHIGMPEIKQKSGTQLTLTLLKGFANNLMVDVTLWNQQVPQEYLNKQVRLEGFRLKTLTKDTFVLVSTVYSKIVLIDRIEQALSFDPEKHYRSLSQVYGERNIKEMKQTLHQLTKCFSIIQVRVKQACAFDYQGCEKCHKKIENQICPLCGVQAEKQTFWVCQLELQDDSGACSVFVFDSQLQGALKLAKKGSVIKGKIRSTIKLDPSGDKNNESHTLVGIKAITF